MFASSFVIFSGLLAASWSYPTGAPTAVCDDMTPQHLVPPQSTPLPNDIAVSKKEAKSGEVVLITISGKDFKGFMVEVRDENDNAVGSFEADQNTQAIDCHGTPGSAATHKNAQDKTEVILKWKAPKKAGEYRVVATIVQNYTTFWARVPLQKIKVN